MVNKNFLKNSLLEKSRVIHQRDRERNYHIFYQLCAGADDILKTSLGLMPAKGFSYLNKNPVDVKSINDKQKFKELTKSMEEAGIVKS
jgi:myosin heavy subunit